MISRFEASFFFLRNLLKICCFYIFFSASVSVDQEGIFQQLGRRELLHQFLCWTHFTQMRPKGQDAIDISRPWSLWIILIADVSCASPKFAAEVSTGLCRPARKHLLWWWQADRHVLFFLQILQGEFNCSSVASQVNQMMCFQEFSPRGGWRTLFCRGPQPLVPCLPARRVGPRRSCMAGMVPWQRCWRQAVYWWDEAGWKDGKTVQFQDCLLGMFSAQFYTQFESIWNVFDVWHTILTHAWCLTHTLWQQL